MMKKFLRTSISAIAIVGLLMSAKLSLPAYAANKGTFKSNETITLQVGDSAILECQRPYGYDSLTPSWEVDSDGIISFTDENPGNTYSSITSATIEATAEGTANITMKAVSPWGEFWGLKTETFTVVVAEAGSDDEPTDVPPTDASDDTEKTESPSSDEGAVASETEEPTTPPSTQENDNPASLKGKTLYVRLVGSFSHMMQGEEDIDAVSSATGVGYKPQESNAVKVQAALVDDGTDKASLSEDAWHDVDYFNMASDAIRPNSDTSKTKVHVSPECPGMEFFYNIWSGKIEASGKATQSGEYEVSIEFIDADGRVATSDAIQFTVYGVNHTLLDSLTYENSTQTSDGKYIYDQTPWYITDLGADTVVAPKDIKAWYGSHSTGTYAEVGNIISLSNGDQPSHSLIIPSGANLTLLNTRIHSDVKVVVENGAKLTLRQSTIEGIIEIQNGGTFSVDYNDFGEEKGFSSGSALNGQLILQDGAILENAHIVSHTNFSARDDVNRKNNQPVVVANGNVTINGEVTIKADEAPDYGVGQKGLEVNGTLTIPDGSSLSVYGGGESQLTSKGGDAIVLNNGTIKGDGTLKAIGGFGMNVTADRSLLGGGSAISGTGEIQMSDVTLMAGNSFENVNIPDITANVTISSYTKAPELDSEDKTTETNEQPDAQSTKTVKDEADNQTTTIAPVTNSQPSANQTTSTSSDSTDGDDGDDSSDADDSSVATATSQVSTPLITAATDTANTTTINESPVPLAVKREISATKKPSTPVSKEATSEDDVEKSIDEKIIDTKDDDTAKESADSKKASETISNEATPLAKPVTNHNNKVLYIVIIATIAAALMGVFVYRKNKR